MAEAVFADTKTHWRVAGQGDRNVLLLHCSLAHSGAWRGVIGHLADSGRFLAMDLPAHGQSGPLSKTLSWQRQSVEMALGIIQQEGAPVDLVGHSFGATVALRLALENPELLRSLTLIEPVLFSAAGDIQSPVFDQHYIENMGFIRSIERGEPLKALQDFQAMWGDGQQWEEVPEKTRQYMAERIAMIRICGNDLWGEGPDYMPLSDIADLRVPLLLIDGAESHPVISVILDAIQSVVPSAERISVAGAAHMVPISHSKQVADRLRAFLKL